MPEIPPRALLDTSVVIASDPTLMPSEGAISTATIGELHFGVQRAPNDDERGARLARLAAVEAEFEPIAFDREIAREWGALSAWVATEGLGARRRAMDLIIAATAIVLDVPLLTRDADFAALGARLDVRVI